DREGGIEGLNIRPELGDDAAARADSGSAAGRRRAIRIHADAGEADAGGSGGDALADVTQKSAGFGAAQHFAGKQRSVTLDLDVDIVFERERNHVLRGEVQVAGAN